MTRSGRVKGQREGRKGESDEALQNSVQGIHDQLGSTPFPAATAVVVINATDRQTDRHGHMETGNAADRQAGSGEINPSLVCQQSAG